MRRQKARRNYKITTNKTHPAFGRVGVGSCFGRDFNKGFFGSADRSGVEGEDMVFGFGLGQAFGHGHRNNGTDALAGLAANERKGHRAAGDDFEVLLAGGAAGDALNGIDQTVPAFHAGVEIVAACSAQLVHGKIGQYKAEADTAADMAVEIDAILNGDGILHEKCPPVDGWDDSFTIARNTAEWEGKSARYDCPTEVNVL